LILYSKKEGIGYLSPLGKVEEGSAVFLSVTGCLGISGMEGLPARIIPGTVAVDVEKFIFCIGAIVLEFRNSITKWTHDTLTILRRKNSTRISTLIY